MNINSERLAAIESAMSQIEKQFGKGRENSKIYLKDNPEIALEIENKIREKYNLPLIDKAKPEGIEEVLNLPLA